MNSDRHSFRLTFIRIVNTVFLQVLQFFSRLPVFFLVFDQQLLCLCIFFFGIYRSIFLKGRFI